MTTLVKEKQGRLLKCFSCNLKHKKELALKNVGSKV